MIIKALIFIALIALTNTKVYNITINDITNTATCNGMYEEANCARCFQSDAQDAQLIKAQSLCYQCNAGSFYWNQWECVALPDHRNIPGWGRSCAECGAGNYWSDTAKSCKPCKYEAAKCSNGESCCNDTVDFACTNTFSLDSNTNRCICSKGDHFKLYDKCYCVGQNDVYMEIDDNTGVVTCKACKDKCNLGCADFTCPNGTYLDGCQCKDVHYTCKTAPNDKEENCTECKLPFEFVTLTDGKKLCMCPCCMVEQNQACVDNSAVVELKNLYCSASNALSIDTSDYNDDQWMALLAGKQSLQLLYKLSVDGNNLQKLYDKCANQTPTIFVISYNGHKAGFIFNHWFKDQSDSQTVQTTAFTLDSRNTYQYNGVGGIYYNNIPGSTFLNCYVGGKGIKFSVQILNDLIAIYDVSGWVSNSGMSINGSPDAKLHTGYELEIYMGI